MHAAQQAGENWLTVYYRLLDSEEARRDVEALFAQATSDVILGYWQAQVNLQSRLLTIDPLLCSTVGRAEGFSTSPARLEKARKDNELNALFEQKRDWERRALIDPPIRAKRLRKLQRDRLESAMKRRVDQVVNTFSRDEKARLRLKKNDPKRDADLVCRFQIRIAELLLKKDKELLVEFVRHFRELE
jgi:hypothetical protein